MSSKLQESYNSFLIGAARFVGGAFAFVGFAFVLCVPFMSGERVVFAVIGAISIVLGVALMLFKPFKYDDVTEFFDGGRTSRPMGDYKKQK